MDDKNGGYWIAFPKREVEDDSGRRWFDIMLMSSPERQHVERLVIDDLTAAGHLPIDRPKPVEAPPPDKPENKIVLFRYRKSTKLTIYQQKIMVYKAIDASEKATSPKDIRHATGLNEGAVYYGLKTLMAEGVIQRVSKGLYQLDMCLLDYEEQPIELTAVDDNAVFDHRKPLIMQVRKPPYQATTRTRTSLS